MLTQLRCRIINCQAQTVSSFACLRVQEELYATLSMRSLVGLENTWKKTLRKSVTRKYTGNAIHTEIEDLEPQEQNTGNVIHAENRTIT